jgi:hypothetical protein
MQPARKIDMTRNIFVLTALIVAVGCSGNDPGAATGDMIVTVTTTGTPDPNGYTLAVSGQTSQPMNSTDTTAFNNLPIGDYTVILHGAEIGCTVVDDSVRAVYQTVGNKFVNYLVTCP